MAYDAPEDTVASTTAYANDLLMRAARGEQTERTPVWLMRQAGRTDPAYNKLRKDCGLALHDLFRHAELAAEVSLLPRRIGVDAIIYFQDILTPLSGMGAHFVFAPGPVLEEPFKSAADVRKLHTFDVEAELPFIPETFRLVRKALDGEMPVLGFAGAPFTLAAFILEGKSPGKEAKSTFKFAEEEPAAFRELLDRIAAMTIDYLAMQIDAGADAVQLFESCAFMMNKAQYKDWALPYQTQIVEGLKRRVPTIMFAREWEDVEDLAATGAAIVSLPATVGVASARKRLGEKQVLQGNVDNHLLAHGPWEQVESDTRRCIEEGAHRGHIFNLSHGLLRETPFERVTALVDLVKSIRVSE